MDKAVMTIAVLVPISMFALIFGIFYLRSREKMGMIERGMDPNSGTKPLNANYMLRLGLIVIGTGLGFLIATIVNRFDEEWGALYPSLMAIFGGSGAILAYVIEKKDINRTGDN
jgi:hypothetical protein